MRILVVVLLSVGISTGAELKVRDIRLLGGSTPETDAPEITFHTSGLGEGVNFFEDEDETKLGMGPRIGVMLIESFGTLGNGGGFLLGLSYAYSHQESETTAHDAVWFDSVGAPVSVAYRDGPIESSVNVVDLHLGWGYAFTKNLHIEVMAFGGIGSLTMDDHGPFIVAEEGSQKPNGPYHEFGLRVGLVLAAWRGLLIGLDGGYLMSEGRSALRYDLGGGRRRDVVYEIDQSGAVANLSIGLRF